MSAAEEFAQYQLHFIDYIQHDYKVIRPIVLFAETITERSRQTGLERTTIGDKARRFVHEGMLGLVDQRAGHAGRKGTRSACENFILAMTASCGVLWRHGDTGAITP